MKCCRKVTESFHSLLCGFGKEKVKLQMKDWSIAVFPLNCLREKTVVLHKNNQK